jgi:hypothetical protein
VVHRGDHDERQRLPGLLRTCAGIAEELPTIDGVEKQTMGGLSLVPKTLSLIWSIGENNFLLGKVCHRAEPGNLRERLNCPHCF